MLTRQRLHMFAWELKWRSKLAEPTFAFITSTSTAKLNIILKISSSNFLAREYSLM